MHAFPCVFGGWAGGLGVVTDDARGAGARGGAIPGRRPSLRRAACFLVRGQRAEGNTKVARFEALLTKLGEFPDKDVINQLTHTAHEASTLLGAAGAKRVTAVLKGALAHAHTPPGRLIPLFYLLDSILKARTTKNTRRKRRNRREIKRR